MIEDLTLPQPITSRLHALGLSVTRLQEMAEGPIADIEPLPAAPARCLIRSVSQMAEWVESGRVPIALLAGFRGSARADYGAGLHLEMDLTLGLYLGTYYGPSEDAPALQSAAKRLLDVVGRMDANTEAMLAAHSIVNQAPIWSEDVNLWQSEMRAADCEAAHAAVLALVSGLAELKTLRTRSLLQAGIEEHYPDALKTLSGMASEAISPDQVGHRLLHRIKWQCKKRSRQWLREREGLESWAQARSNEELKEHHTLEAIEDWRPTAEYSIIRDDLVRKGRQAFRDHAPEAYRVFVAINEHDIPTAEIAQHLGRPDRENSRLLRAYYRAMTRLPRWVMERAK